jgi:transketolase
MRDTFIESLRRRAIKNPEVILLTADLGFGVMDKFRSDVPQQFINVGIAEQNMIGLATGLSFQGYEVFCYSIGNFPTFRCLEQIRNDALYHEANVRIVSVGGGYSYGPLGMSHHMTEDVAIMRALPGMGVYTPSTLQEVHKIGEELEKQAGPAYIRLDKGFAEIEVSEALESIPLWSTVRDGTDVTLVTYGSLLSEVLAAAVTLEHHSISTRVISAAKLAPISLEAVALELSDARLIVSVEEHSSTGGLGTILAEALSQSAARPRLLRLHAGESINTKVGSQVFMRRTVGLDSASIAQRVAENFL